MVTLYVSFKVHVYLPHAAVHDLNVVAEAELMASAKSWGMHALSSFMSYSGPALMASTAGPLALAGLAIKNRPMGMMS